MMTAAAALTLLHHTNNSKSDNVIQLIFTGNNPSNVYISLHSLRYAERVWISLRIAG